MYEQKTTQYKLQGDCQSYMCKHLILIYNYVDLRSQAELFKAWFS